MFKCIFVHNVKKIIDNKSIKFLFMSKSVLNLNLFVAIIAEWIFDITYYVTFSASMIAVWVIF